MDNYPQNLVWENLGKRLSKLYDSKTISMHYIVTELEKLGAKTKNRRAQDLYASLPDDKRKAFEEIITKIENGRTKIWNG
jgi:hypothetical protein